MNYKKIISLNNIVIAIAITFIAFLIHVQINKTLLVHANKEGISQKIYPIKYRMIHNIQTAVEHGKITQEEANKKLEYIKNKSTLDK